LRDMFGPLVLSPQLPERTSLQQTQGAAKPLHMWPGESARDMAHNFDQLLDRVIRAGHIPVGESNLIAPQFDAPALPDTMQDSQPQQFSPHEPSGQIPQPTQFPQQSAQFPQTPAQFPQQPAQAPQYPPQPHQTPQPLPQQHP